MNRTLLTFLVLSLTAFAQMTPDALVDRIVRRIEARRSRTFEILILSGGGEYGAYGAGFLRGWKSRTGDPMPDFDMVTGISTGALIAPYAFAGDAGSLAEISAEYTGRANGIKPSFDLFFLLKRDGGLLNRGKLESTIKKLYGEKLASRMRTGLEQGRILLIGTTNLRTGIGAIWSVEEELRNESTAGIAFLQKILLASTAVPGAFAPVDLKGDPHVDGGVASNTLLGLDLDDFRELARRLAHRTNNEPVRTRLWVVVNKPVYPTIDPGNFHNPMAVHDRSDRILFGLKELMTPTRYRELSEAVNSSLPSLRMEVHYTAVPPDMAINVTLRNIVDPVFMKQLDQYGYERARSQSPWDRLPLSAYRRP